MFHSQEIAPVKSEDKMIIKSENIAEESSSKNVLLPLKTVENTNDMVIVPVPVIVESSGNLIPCQVQGLLNEIVDRVILENKNINGNENVLINENGNEKDNGLTIIVKTENSISNEVQSAVSKRTESKRRTTAMMNDVNARFLKNRKYMSLGLGENGEELDISALTRLASLAAIYIHATG